MRHIPALVLLMACGSPVTTDLGGDGVQLQRARAAAAGDHGFVAIDLLAVDEDGFTVPCIDGEVSASFTITLPDGTVQSMGEDDLTVVCRADEVPHVAVVLDNSGSQESVLEDTRAGARALVDGVLAAGGKASLVRVSTFSEPLVPLTDDATALHDGLDGMFVNRGWTSLYDAMRMANASLADAPQDTVESELEAFCASDSTTEMVVFSNGVDNNSAEQKLTGGGDGVDTTLADVVDLSLEGVTTPIHTIGLGDDLDSQTLRDLSLATGGGHVTVASEDWIPNAFDLVSGWTTSTFRVCAEVPDDTCGTTTVEVEYEVRAHCNQGLGNGYEGCDPGNSNNTNPSNDEPDSPGRGNGNGNGATNGNGGNGNGNTVVVGSGTRTYEVHLPCEDGGAQGHAATVLFGLSAQGIPSGHATALVRNLVSWAEAGAGNGRVLVVADDTASDVDALFVEDALSTAGWDVTLVTEPAHGLGPSDIAPYEVVWFSTGDRPMDDWASYDTLRWFESTGRGVILQGDDASHGLGGAVDPIALTGLTHLDNGVEACGVRTDDGGTYTVTFGDSAHPVLSGLEGLSVTYAGDVDHTTASAAEVLAWATVTDADDCDVQVPAVVAHLP